jgi:predicted KAP-like P-loop ATPase
MSANYASDAPILDPGEDKFNRLPFAKRIADAIAGRSDTSSIVVGIYGAWGQGKTSVLNLIEHQLGAHKGLEVLRFNPWRYQNEDQILVAFFEAIANLLGEELYTWVERKAKSVVGKAASKGAKSVPYGEGAGELIEFLSAVEVESLKERVEKKLLTASKRIVVLVDDIDRLDNDEVFAIFRLVKLTANFRHVSFILAFDDEVVSSALQERYAHRDNEPGRSFLEKIIQVPLELPQVQQSLLRRYCLEGIERALNDSKVHLKEGQAQAFVSAFDSGLMPIIKTPRAVMRYENVLTFTLPILEGDLNVIDLMLLEGVRLFYPPVYDAMRLDRDTFLAKREMFENWESAKKRVLEKLDAILAILPPEQRKACSSLLEHMFPNLSGIRSNFQGSVDHKQAHLDKRISSTRYYDRYFALNIPEGDISDTRIDRIIQMASNAPVDLSALVDEIQQAIKDSTAEAVIFKLGLHDDRLNAEAIRALSLAICQCGDSIPQTTTFFSLGGPRRQAAWMLSGLLDKITIKDDRVSLAKELMEKAEPLAFGVEILYSLPTQKDDPSPAALTAEEKAQIGTTLSQRFIQLAASGEFFTKSNDDVSRLISAWDALGDKVALTKHLVDHIEASPQYASRLITTMRPTVSTMGLPGTSKGDLEFPTYQFIIALVPVDLMLRSIRETYGDKAQPTNEWPRSLRGDDDDLKSAQQFLWRHAHNAKPDGERTEP